jgi:HK97 family phage prohead protease
METRIFNGSRLQLRSAESGEMCIGGYAARFNIASKPIPSRNGGSFQEVLMPGAFRDVLGNSDLDCVALVNHDANKVLGRTSSRTLRLSSDHLGLQFEVDLSPNISHHRDVYEQVKRGDLAGCSFAFQVGEDDWREGSGYPVRTIRSVKALRDVSVVTDPAYEHTEVGVRSEVDLCEVRSRFAIKLPWRQERLWRDSCEHYGLNPDTATTWQLGRAYERRAAAESRIVVARRCSFLQELLS